MLTPNVLTEASNLLESFTIDKEKVGLESLKRLIEEIPESFREAKKLVAFSSFQKFGLADASMESVCKEGVVPITVDFPLYGYLASSGYEVINFNHVRSF